MKLEQYNPYYLRPVFSHLLITLCKIEDKLASCRRLGGYRKTKPWKFCLLWM